MSRILEDMRPISMVWSTGAEDDMVGATVGVHGVTRIEPYEETGEMAMVTWFKVWKGDVLIARLNCAHMAEITYSEEARNAD